MQSKHSCRDRRNTFPAHSYLWHGNNTTLTLGKHYYIGGDFVSSLRKKYHRDSIIIIVFNVLIRKRVILYKRKNNHNVALFCRSVSLYQCSTLAKIRARPGTSSSAKLLVLKKVGGLSQDEFLEYRINNTKMQ